MGAPEELLLSELWYCQNHKRTSFDEHLAPTQWIYDRSTEKTHERCVKKRVDFPLEAVRQPDSLNEIPQVT